MKLSKFFTIIFALLLFTQCNSPLNLYKKGNYQDAVIAAVKKLRAKPDNAKAQEALTAAYPMAQQNALRTVSNLKASQNPQKHYSIVQQYEALNRLASEIYRCPKALTLVQPTEFVAELQNARETAAEEFYSLGKATFIGSDVRQARVARSYFISADYFVKGYKDVEQMIADAEFYSTLRVLVKKPLTNRAYQLSADFFFDNLLTELRRVTKDKLVVFYSEEQAKTEKIYTPHQTVTLDFLDFTVGNAKETSNTIECKKDSVKVGEVEIGGKKYPAYNTVKATLTTYTLELSSGGILKVKVMDFGTNRMLREQNFSGSYVWRSQWAISRGDDRALTAAQKRLCSRRQEIPPAPQDLFIEFTKPIYSKTVSYLNNYYLTY
ncbi:MAG: hypothetical protein LBS50_09230 [Prevotellaceae bacterium]|jgi:hypothetical protein|nr:hypothetical protein [Prevotellaceae bacterium]